MVGFVKVHYCVYITQNMKSLLYPFILSALLGCSSAEHSLSVTNTADVSLTAQPVIVTPDLLQLTSGTSYFILLDDGEELPCQYDDLNDDGSWDELVFQMDLGPNQSKRITLSEVATPKKYPVKTNVHLGYSPKRDNNFMEVQENTMPSDHIAQSTPYLYQFEGPGWENNLVGFRAYFDSRNGKDIFGKVTEDMVLDQVGTGENYHALQEWGMDILKVGNSLGAGALALKKGDSLVRLSEVEEQKFRVIFEGPVRSRFQLTFSDWNVGDKRLQLNETIEIWANKWYYESTIDISSIEDTLVTGIVNLHQMNPHEFSLAGQKVLYTYGEQSENKDALGMGLVVAEKEYLDWMSIPDKTSGIGSTEAVLLHSTDGTTSYAFIAGWSLSNEDFTTSTGFVDLL